VHDKKASRACGITTLDEAVAATRYNNDYFMKHRQGKNNGGAKFLNVLQGDNHTSAEEWYQEMKEYCDPTKYPDTHFDGWAMGGQNMCDVHLVLKRLVALRYDNLLQEGVHDWMHFLGTSKLEWAVLLTVIQRAVRKYVNPAFTISFDCASPFLATANGQVYFENVFEHQDKWSYRMAQVLDDKKYASDTRKWGATLLTDLPKDSNIKNWQDSPISSMLTMKDICIYGPSDLNKNGKEGKTSWDSFSYGLYMAHNVAVHIDAVQRANKLMDMECARYKPDWRQWKKLNEKEARADSPSEWVPRNILYFDNFVQELFESDDPKGMLKHAHRFLTELQGGLQRGKVQNDVLNSFLEFEEPQPSENDLANMNDDKILELEKSVDD